MEILLTVLMKKTTHLKLGKREFVANASMSIYCTDFLLRLEFINVNLNINTAASEELNFLCIGLCF